MKVDTTPYQDEHGKRPGGYGTWVFVAMADGAGTEIMKVGTYTEALSAAWAEARTIGGATELVVQP